ncbi:MAG: hypothetical protein QF704_17455, partial [Anaerolineales bacterium]|nr:hypothetical protein [Anaerolineales bacterium]
TFNSAYKTLLSIKPLQDYFKLNSPTWAIMLIQSPQTLTAIIPMTQEQNLTCLINALSLLPRV